MAALRGDISFRYLKQFFLVIKGIRTISFRYLKHFFLVIKGIRTQSVKIKGTSL
jgi:hypothetical protein